MNDEEILKLVRKHEDNAAAKAEQLRLDAQQAEAVYRAIQKLRYAVESGTAKPTQVVGRKA
jgi:putative hemolysin